MASWPNFFIVGAAKAGTTSLYRYLGQHPDVYMSPRKEPHFFSAVNPDPSQRWFVPTVSDEAAYLELFAGAGGQRAVGEASTSYLWDPHAAERISKKMPQAKIVIMLRDPIERAFSHYLMDVREGIQTKSFTQALEEDAGRPVKGWGVSHLYLELGQYAGQVERYLAVFPRSQVHIVFFETFTRDTSTCVLEVLRFLGINPDPSEILSGMNVSDRFNAYAAPKGAWAGRLLGSPALRQAARRLLPRGARGAAKQALLLRKPDSKPQIDAEARSFLSRHYDAEIRALEELLGFAVPWNSPSPPQAHA
ncbi:MAG TPA: sulfotransferase [Trueperaceae bacterium]